ncbi:MAG: peroxiredoxin [Candidatus Acididesulfobacter diazotrophicus]|jgi:predicted peroxiredoxin|uniref:Peroxiredoxin n=1 Tax=Candidatus Acididesulfobacter diazotrophicus TaxID=2597226 RepID=A0A519BJR9_9DELT|nr:MAG: peroxiredoxin [Candidatus Acididesulfobacter diazotrophicus]
MANKLFIMLQNTTPDNPHQLGAPFFQAAAAATMDYEVEMVLTADAGLLMKKGVAENLRVKTGSPKSVYDFIKDAHEAGVVLKVCTPALELNNFTKDDLIPECSGVVGGAYVVEMAMDDDVKVLAY